MVPSGEEEAKGGSNHCHPPPLGADEKVEPDSSWRDRARGNRRKSQRGKFWLERKKNAHHGDRETLEPVPGVSALGSAHSSAGPALSSLLQLFRPAWRRAGAGQETLGQVPSAQSSFVIL